MVLSQSKEGSRLPDEGGAIQVDVIRLWALNMIAKVSGRF